VKRAEVAELVHLPCDRFDDFRVIVAHGYAPEPGEPVHDLPALQIANHHPVSFHHNPRRMVVLEVPGMGQGVDQVRPVQVGQRFV
jgi:hypothetical protein